jgi:hypothetical protein
MKSHLGIKENINEIHIDGFSKERSCPLPAHSSGSFQPNELMPIILAFSICSILVLPLTISIL